MAKILLLNGPNLNLLGSRQPQVYSNQNLAQIEQHCQALAQQLGHDLICYQSNMEGELINQIGQAPQHDVQFIIINPAAYTHTSIALRDALLAVNLPFIELHISNIFAREEFRHHSYLADIAYGVITGFGPYGYELAIQAIDHYFATKH